MDELGYEQTAGLWPAVLVAATAGLAPATPTFVRRARRELRRPVQANAARWVPDAYGHSLHRRSVGHSLWSAPPPVGLKYTSLQFCHK